VLEATLEALNSSAFGADVPTGFLTIAAIDAHAALVYARRAGHDFVLPQTPALLQAGRELVEEAHRDGVRVGTWVTDDPAELETLFSWEVDAVAANDPAAAVEIRERVSAQ
jgi:glycerophosphoryl diester phosphodiesterase